MSFFTLNFFFSSPFTDTKKMKGGKVIKMFDYALFVCVCCTTVCIRCRKWGRWERPGQGKRMRQRKRWDLWSHLFTRGLSPEQPFTVVNHLHGDILKVWWMGGFDAFQTWLWYTLERMWMEATHLALGLITPPSNRKSWASS